MGKDTVVCAAMIAIGDELLSGRTKDKNIAHMAELLTLKGIELVEVRIVADDIDAIVGAVNALRKQHDYVFTSGGIGPTHDDITTQAIGEAFEVGVHFHPQAYQMLERHYNERQIEFTPARKKMAQTPVGASLIKNPVSVAPGFRMENVFVLAGVPAVFKAMVISIEPDLAGGKILLAACVDCPHGEGTIGDDLTKIAQLHREVSIGSYPRFDNNSYSTQIVLRARSQGVLDAAHEAVTLMVKRYS